LSKCLIWQLKYRTRNKFLSNADIYVHQCGLTRKRSPFGNTFTISGLNQEGREKVLNIAIVDYYSYYNEPNDDVDDFP